MIKIGIEQLRNKTEVEFHFYGSRKDLGLQDLSFPLQNCEVYLHLMEADRGFYMTGNISGSALLDCHRCLSEFEYPLDVAINTFIVLDHQEEFDGEDEIVMVPAGAHVIDLTKVIRDALLLDLPFKILCSDECKGLCSKCGQNLNKGECTCTDDSIDPRWEKLKEINFED